MKQATNQPALDFFISVLFIYHGHQNDFHFSSRIKCMIAEKPNPEAFYKHTGF
jgi:hypothetical protein